MALTPASYSREDTVLVADRSHKNLIIWKSCRACSKFHPYLIMKFSGDIFIGGSKIKPLYDFTEASSLDIVTQKILGHIFIYPCVFSVRVCMCG